LFVTPLKQTIGVAVGVIDGVIVLVGVIDGVTVLVGVIVGVIVGDGVIVLVGVIVGVTVLVGVIVGVIVGVTVLVGVIVGVIVGVTVGVVVGVGEGQTPHELQSTRPSKKPPLDNGPVTEYITTVAHPVKLLPVIAHTSPTFKVPGIFSILNLFVGSQQSSNK
jgi:hypothetical protein